MRDVSDGPGLKGMVAEEVSNQIDVTEVLGDGGLEDSIDGGDVGAAVGRQFGEQFGRDVGASVGRTVHETIAADVEDGKELGEIRADLSTAIRDTLQESFSELEGRDSLASMAKDVTDGSSVEGLLDGIGGDESGGQTEPQDEKPADEAEEQEDEGKERDEPDAKAAVKEAADKAGAAVEGTADNAKETAEDVTSESKETTEEADSSGNGKDESSMEHLEDRRKDTLEDFLGVLSDSDLQSIAKDVGVKANRSREEMTAEIIEAVMDDEPDSDSNEELEPAAEAE
nr:hypothetical protein [Natrinema hispanicum]